MIIPGSQAIQNENPICSHAWSSLDSNSYVFSSITAL